MYEIIHDFISNYYYILPAVFLVSFVWFKIHSKSENGNTFKNSAFVALVAFLLLFFSKPIEEKIIATPADF